MWEGAWRDERLFYVLHGHEFNKKHVKKWFVASSCACVRFVLMELYISVVCDAKKWKVVQPAVMQKSEC